MVHWFVKYQQGCFCFIQLPACYVPQATQRLISAQALCSPYSGCFSKVHGCWSVQANSDLSSRVDIDIFTNLSINVPTSTGLKPIQDSSSWQHSNLKEPRRLDKHDCLNECTKDEAKAQGKMKELQTRVATAKEYICKSFNLDDLTKPKDASSVSAAIKLKPCSKPAIYLACLLPANSIDSTSVMSPLTPWSFGDSNRSSSVASQMARWVYPALPKTNSSEKILIELEDFAEVQATVSLKPPFMFPRLEEISTMKEVTSLHPYETLRPKELIALERIVGALIPLLLLDLPSTSQFKGLVPMTEKSLPISIEAIPKREEMVMLSLEAIDAYLPSFPLEESANPRSSYPLLVPLAAPVPTFANVEVSVPSFAPASASASVPSLAPVTECASSIFYPASSPFAASCSPVSFPQQEEIHSVLVQVKF
mmetsp:Transcript_17543/g.36612  ORF Transcript_17543/g.36612 Transcript_17543/m.36612 type:complete len:423 (+) Transcript_17543:1428-2696(+)